MIRVRSFICVDRDGAVLVYEDPLVLSLLDFRISSENHTGRKSINVAQVQKKDECA